VAFDLRAIIPNAADPNQIGLAKSIEEDITTLSDQAIGRPRGAATVAQVIAANAAPEFWPCHTAMAFWISRNVPQGGHQQHLVAQPCCLAEAVLRVGEELDDVLGGGG